MEIDRQMQAQEEDNFKRLVHEQGIRKQLAIEALSQLKNLHLVKVIRTKIPQELQHLVWYYLWDSCPSWIHIKIQRKEHWVNSEYIQRAKKPAVRRSNKRGYPHWLDPAYVGDETKFNIVDAFYRRFKMFPSNRLISRAMIWNALNVDLFGVGYEPFHVVRALNVDYWLPLGQLAARAYQDTLDYFEPLLAIANKKNFQLTICLRQYGARWDNLARIIDALRVITTDFREAHATIQVTYFTKDMDAWSRDRYCRDIFPPPIPGFSKDITAAISEPGTGFMEELAKALTTVSSPVKLLP
ncbi:hypothetical protein EJ04DRAFT_59216 [Polyplosphaeria fusca]|uniref:Uncharacterized protein n=1 Tax=Polyplosphaeria fusca TaxID=682080 RepID=A0A9P4QRJ5_9PLEO|nr:hypothetical protein EJ04DRAFT_59216 [Polyplosphaeria fusca]